MYSSKNANATEPEDTLGKENYVKIVRELQINGLLDVGKLYDLSYDERNQVFQEILRWSVFGKRDLKTLKITPPTVLFF
jgi:hypothetical protein